MVCPKELKANTVELISGQSPIVGEGSPEGRNLWRYYDHDRTFIVVAWVTTIACMCYSDCLIDRQSVSAGRWDKRKESELSWLTQRGDCAAECRWREDRCGTGTSRRCRRYYRYHRLVAVQSAVQSAAGVKCRWQADWLPRLRCHQIFSRHFNQHATSTVQSAMTVDSSTRYASIQLIIMLTTC